MQEHAFSVRVDRHPDDRSRLRDRLRSWLADVGAATADREDILLTSWGAVANGLEHPILDVGTVAEIEIVVRKDGGHLFVSVADEGRWRVRREPRAGRGLDLRPIGALLDRVEIDRTQIRDAGAEVSAPRPLPLRALG